MECKRATKLVRGCVVMMKRESGMMSYGNAQCIQGVIEPLGEISLFGHNECYKDYHVASVLEYPMIPCDTPPKEQPK